LNALPSPAALINSEGVILTVNESWCTQASREGTQVSGFGPGHNYLNSYDVARERGFSKATEAALGIRGVLTGELEKFVMDYSSFSPAQPQWFRISVNPIERSRPRSALVMHLDISLQKTAEWNLQRQETQYLLLLNSTREGILTLEASGICTFCNGAAARLLGYEAPDEVVGSILHQQHYSRTNRTARLFCEPTIHQAILAGEVSHADDEFFFRVDGTQFPVEYWSHPILQDGTIVGTVVTFFDITDQIHFRSEFLHSQKMEVVGRLAGGVAHDFKNALAVISGYGGLLEERLAADADGRKYARQICIAAERAASFTRQLLGLNRKESLNPILLDLNAVVVGMEEMLRRIIGEDVTLTVVLPPKLPPVRADLGQIEQILLNLIANSRDAMPRGGELVIHTSTVHADGYVALSVSDNGCGMDQSTQDRIFEPFFTTKAPGKGSGLGLSTVKQIVSQNGGHIFVHSESGVGTSFQIYLPIVAGIPDDLLLSELPQRALRGSETILVVEDEEALRILVSNSLRDNGYTVLEAPDGTSGIESARRSHKLIDLVLTDVVLPDTDGRGVAEKLLESNRSLEVLYMSGYSDEYITNLGIFATDSMVLEKPFDLQVMLMTVRKALDRVVASRQSLGEPSEPFLRRWPLPSA
jgi:PAS domain S-box-containing protein